MTAPRSALLGIFTRKERWSLSGRGWLLAILLVLSLGTLAFFKVHPFLALTDPVPSDFLVVEGWIPEYALHACVIEFRAHSYEKVFTTGGPTMGRGPTNIFNTMAHAGTCGLQALGLPIQKIQTVPALTSDRDRTYSSAIALRDWLRVNHASVHAVNVMTLDVHARRTRLLYQKALGPRIDVGVISIPSQDYPGNDWFHYSEGVKEVISEAGAYIYARFLFYPDD
jgi:hypothetical protein